MSENGCVRGVADEILRGQIIGLGEPLSYPGIVIVPIIRLGETLLFGGRLSRTTLTENVHKVIIGSLPRNTCGVFVLDSLGDVVAFKLHQEVSTFWERIAFVERLVQEHYKDTRKPIGKASATARTMAFLIKLKLEGPKGIMSSKTDYFAISRCEPEGISESPLESTAAILYCAAR
ncbi:MAG: hypothetical protein ACFFDM_03285 [Candidatus Thorarchaeota archaeon]